MRINNVTFIVGRRADGSAAFVLHHGGDRYQIELDDADRRELGRLLLEPLYECVGTSAMDECVPGEPELEGSP